MAIEKGAYKLDSEVVERGDLVVEDQITLAYSNAAAMYEALFDAIATGDSTQGWSGHDHAKGGGPITRGVSHSSDGGESYLYLYTPIVARQKALIDSDGTYKNGGTVRYYGSPLWTAGASMLAGYICYEASGSKFELSLVETSGNAISSRSQEAFITLEDTGEGGPRWIELPGIPLNPGRWNHLEIYAENETHDGTTDPTLKIYGIYITEAPGVTRYQPGLLLSPLDMGGEHTQVTSGLAFAAFEPLDTWLVDDRHWLDADTLARLVWHLNGLYEGTLDKVAPGIATQTVRGHDHEDYGGLGITRNCVARFGEGMRQPWQVDVTTGEDNTSTPATSDATWIKADRDTGGTGAGIRSTANVPHTIGPVGPVIASTGVGSSAPYLDAWIYVSASALSVVDYTVRCAIYNRTTTAWSAVGTITTVSGASGLKGWVYLDEIACSADQFNDFDFYFQCTKEPVSIFLHEAQISESADVWAGTTYTRVARLENASVTTQLGVAPNGPEPRS